MKFRRTKWLGFLACTLLTVSCTRRQVVAQEQRARSPKPIATTHQDKAPAAATCPVVGVGGKPSGDKRPLDPTLATLLASRDGLFNAQFRQRHPELTQILADPETPAEVLAWLGTNEAHTTDHRNVAVGALQLVAPLAREDGTRPHAVGVARSFAQSSHGIVRAAAFELLVTAFFNVPAHRPCLLETLRAMMEDADDSVRSHGARFIARAQAQEELGPFLRQWRAEADPQTVSFELVGRLLPEVDVIRTDVSTILAGDLTKSPDRDATLARLHARAPEFLDEFERRVGGLAPFFLAELEFPTLLQLVRIDEPVRVRTLAAKLVAEYDRALSRVPTKPSPTQPNLTKQHIVDVRRRLGALRRAAQALAASPVSP